MGPKNSGEKEPDRLTRESVAEGHRRKSKGMWYWAWSRWKDGETVGRGTGGGWPEDNWY